MLRSRFVVLALALALLLVGLPLSVSAQESGVTASPVPPPIAGGPPDAVVHAGDSIQAAVDAARPGDVIHIEPGAYAEAILVETPRLSLVGLRGEDGQTVVIENPGAEINGIEVTDPGDGFVLASVTVRGFGKNGVLLTDVDGFRLADVIAEDNGEYGFFPSLSTHGVIERCTASGHHDSGIYVGLSADVEVRESVAFDNVTGIIIENVSDVRVVDNESYDNRVGIGLVLLPGLAWTTSTDVTVSGNNVHDNNHAAFPEAEELAAAIPTGVGILAIGTDRVTISENRVTNNAFVGIAVASLTLISLLAQMPADALTGMEPNPDDVRVESNVLSGNGTKSSVPLFPARDLIWDNSGVNNCWQDNQYATSFPDVLPPCSGGPSS